MQTSKLAEDPNGANWELQFAIKHTSPGFIAFGRIIHIPCKLCQKKKKLRYIFMKNELHANAGAVSQVRFMDVQASTLEVQFWCKLNEPRRAFTE